MLGTFSFEPYFKSYPCFTFMSLEISEIAKQPVFPFPCLPTCLLTAAVQSAAHPLWRAASPRHLLPASFHASRLSLPSPSFPRAGASLAMPRRLEPPRGRHLAVAVARPRQRPPPSPGVRMSLTRTTKLYSSCSFAFPSLSRSRTPPPLHPERRRAQATVEPTLRTSPPLIDPATRSASPSCS
jgi:hypothetical protein